jgi:phosphopantothenoylcysteine decarboxylase/phosphopantothenate--cysteine ligase
MQGRHILLGVSGSIASYKAAFLIRLFIKAGAEVKVIMTPEATRFISPLTLSTLSKNEVVVYLEKENGLWNNHVDLGLWADIFLICPATASTLSRMARGLSDNALVATYLSARCPVFFAPAMDLDMWEHPSTQRNCQDLISFGNRQIGPGTGELASGLNGDGRMAEPEEIFDRTAEFFKNKNRFLGLKVLITAGPTQEALDPVRYISNHSSGKMGYALAENLAEEGAEVTLISGPSSLKIHHSNIHLIKVLTAHEMYQAAIQYFPGSRLIILTAAVADYRPIEKRSEKIKSRETYISLELEKTPDIAQNLGEKKQSNQVLVGFALETDHEIEHAREKIRKKNLDLIVLNSLKDEGAAFGHDTNKITLIDQNGAIRAYDLKSKSEVASDIIEYLSTHKGIGLELSNK